MQLVDRDLRQEFLQQRVEGSQQRCVLEIEEALEEVLLLLVQTAEIGGQESADLLQLRDGHQTGFLERGIELDDEHQLDSGDVLDGDVELLGELGGEQHDL